MTENQPTQIYVPFDYEMDPSFDDLIRGDKLQDGMIVLIESSLVRANPESIHSVYDTKRVRETARWCVVTDLSITPRLDRDEWSRSLGPRSPLISFVGLYSDGTKISRQYDASYYWYVKIDSIPSDESALEED